MSVGLIRRLLPTEGAPTWIARSILAWTYTIGGNLTITGLQTCFLGVIRNTIKQNFVLNGNVDANPDGNELADNSIGHNLNCEGNSPIPQIGDSGGGLNMVFGRANGQCGNPALVL